MKINWISLEYIILESYANKTWIMYFFFIQIVLNTQDLSE